MSELNPNHPVVQWHKFCAILLFKSGATEIDIFPEDVERFMASGVANILVHSKADRITLRLVSDAESRDIAKQTGGLPV